MPRQATTAIQLPFPYRFFFLFLEPLSALVGAYFAYFRQAEYLSLIDRSPLHHQSALPVGTAVALSQLANMYLFFALNEALVLRSTSDLRVWKTVLFGLLIGDLGHLYACRPLGLRVYYDVLGWNAMDVGSVPFVYVGASMRLAFLLGVGLGGTGRHLQQQQQQLVRRVASSSSPLAASGKKSA